MVAGISGLLEKIALIEHGTRAARIWRKGGMENGFAVKSIKGR